MIRSMTGFGKGEVQDAHRSYSVQLKSVNNRFLELGLKLPTDLWAHEGEARTLLQAALNRGKVDIYWKESRLAGSEDTAPVVDSARAKAWRDALAATARQLGLPEDIKLDTLTRLPGVLRSGDDGVPEAAEEDGARWAGMKAALGQAITGLQASREGEGAQLEKELRALMDEGEARVADIEARSLALQSGFAEKLRKRISQILETLPPDDPRIAMEAALLVDKADIREELVRFRAHTAEFRRLLAAKEPVGKKLDFLCQELLREANTMGSKSPEAALTQAVVGLKSVVERIKEQGMNVE